MLENDLGGTPATAMPSAARRVRGRLQIPPIQHVHELGDSRLTHHQESSVLQHVVISVRRGVLEFGNRKQVGAIRDAKFGLCLYGGSYHFRLAAADTAVEQLVTVAAPNRGRRDPGYRFHICWVSSEGWPNLASRWKGVNAREGLPRGWPRVSGWRSFVARTVE